MDLAKLSLDDLKKLQKDIVQTIETREKQTMIDAREKILAIAKEMGVSVSDLVGNGKPIKPVQKVAAQYRSTKDDKLEWSGRGRMPNFIKEELASGKTLEDLRIKKD